MKIAIVGAGLSGLSAGLTLKSAGMSPVIFDKGRNVGGRCATRPTDWGAIDHGVQHFDGGDDRITALFDTTGIASKRVTFHPGTYQPVHGAGPFVVPLDGARALADAMASTLDVRVSHSVTGLDYVNSRWNLTCGDVSQGAFDSLILAIPPEQAAAFNLHQGQLDLDKATYTPQVTALIANDIPLDLPDTGPLPQDGLAWISKSSDGKRATVLTEEPLSSDLMETDKDDIAAQLWAEIGGGPEPRYLKGHRWRYARVATAIGTSHHWDAARSLGYCGDWFIGPNAGDAIESGRALAQTVLCK